jgi:putative membrane protein
MPSEQRLHPASIAFALAGSLKALALPALLVLLGTSRAPGGPGRGWEFWAALFLIPATLGAIARYVSFRLRYDESEMVIRTGILFRNERHVPYARIQNLGAVRNVFHRLLGVTEVRVETGGGKEVEATISVIRVEAFEEMRRRVFGAAAAAPTGDADRATAAVPAAGETVLGLPIRELVLLGLIENRSLLVIGALAGLLWELGLADALADRLLGDSSYGRGVIREVVLTVARGGPLPLGQILLVLGAAAGLLAAVQLASIAWTVTRFYGFRLERAGEDLRTEYGLLTRVTGTIPIRRVQTLTISEGPLQRLARRVAIRVETAGGVGAAGGGSIKEREWLAPIAPRSMVPDLVAHILPELAYDRIDWRGVHPRAPRRATNAAAAAAVAVSLLSSVLIGRYAVVALVLALPWFVVSARMQVRHLAWSADDDVVVFRSGWIRRRLTVARVVKVQAVALTESPFDRRTGMARVHADTAGASERSHRVSIPYLPREVARQLHRHIAGRAAQTVFRW